MGRVLTEEEIAARNALIERMQREQEMRDRVAPTGQRTDDNIERCPHGVPLRKSCPKCDVVTEADIQDRIPVQQ